MNALELTGRARTHVVQRDDLRAAVHPQALEAFLAMREQAARDGIELAVFSAFRDFDAQLAIWNRKYRGERPLFDLYGVEDEIEKALARRVDLKSGGYLIWEVKDNRFQFRWKRP